MLALFIIGIFTVNIYELRSKDPKVVYFNEHIEIDQYFKDVDLENKYLQIQKYLNDLIRYEDIELQLENAKQFPFFEVTYSIDEINEFENYKSIFSDNIKEEIKILSTYSKYLNEILYYDSYIDNVIESSQNIIKQPSYKSYPTWQKEVFDVIPDTYAKLVDISLKDTSYLAVERLESNPIVNLMTLLFISIIVLFVFNENQEKLILTTVNGRYKTLISKIVVSIFFTLIVQNAFLILNFLIFQFKYGLVNLNLFIQNVSYFYESPFYLTIKEYYILKLLFNSIVTTSLLLLLLAIISITHNIKLSIITYMVYIGLSGMSYYLIPSLSKYSLIKYINSYATLHFGEMIKNYIYFPIFNIPIFYNQGALVAVFVTILTSLIVVFKYYLETNKVSLKRFSLSQKFNEKTFSKVSLIYFENIKLMIFNKGILFIMLLLLINFSMVKNVFDNGISEYEKNRQEIYHKLESKSTEELDLFFDEVLNEYSLHKADFNELKYKDSLDEHDIKFIQEYHNNNSYYRTIEKMHEDYYKSGKQLVYASGFQFLISEDTYNQELMYSTLLLMFVSLTTSTIFNEDKINDQERLYIVSEKGNKNRRNSKFITIFIVLTGLFVIFNLSIYLSYNHFF